MNTAGYFYWLSFVGVAASLSVALVSQRQFLQLCLEMDNEVMIVCKPVLLYFIFVLAEELWPQNALD